MKKSDLYKINPKNIYARGTMKNKNIIAYTMILLLFWGFHVNRNAKHNEEIKNIMAHEMQVKDSLGIYIEEMAAALDLFTNGQPLVFTAYNALWGQGTSAIPAEFLGTWI